MDEERLKAEVGERLRKAIERAGWKSQAEFADSLDWLPRSTLNAWITGARLLPLDKAILLAPKLGCTPQYLLTLESTPEEDRRLKAISELYKGSDERGKALILRVAEQESAYNGDNGDHQARAS